MVRLLGHRKETAAPVALDGELARYAPILRTAFLADERAVFLASGTMSFAVDRVPGVHAFPGLAQAIGRGSVAFPRNRRKGGEEALRSVTRDRTSPHEGKPPMRCHVAAHESAIAQRSIVCIDCRPNLQLTKTVTRRVSGANGPGSSCRPQMPEKGGWWRCVGKRAAGSFLKLGRRARSCQKERARAPLGEKGQHAVRVARGPVWRC